MDFSVKPKANQSVREQPEQVETAHQESVSPGAPTRAPEESFATQTSGVKTGPIGAESALQSVQPEAQAQMATRALGNTGSLLGREVQMHHVARTQAPKQYPQRWPVSDTQVSWASAAPNYAPAVFTAPSVLANDETVKSNGWADPPSIAQTLARRSLSSLEGPVQFGLSKNYVENNQAVQLPLNPRGRTGIEGRGLLGRWGANPAGDAIVTRINPQTQKLELLAIQRKDTGQWALPGGMVDKNETPPQTVARELHEETGVTLDFTQGNLIYGGYVDDPRNTDNAWMETTAIHLHLPASTAASLEPKAGDDAQNCTWIPLSQDTLKSMYASHADIVRRLLASSAPTIG